MNVESCRKCVMRMRTVQIRMEATFVPAGKVMWATEHPVLVSISNILIYQ